MSFVTGTGSSVLKFRYTVVAGDNGVDGTTVGTLTLNGGTIQNTNNTADADLALNGVPSTDGVLVDTVILIQPSIISEPKTIEIIQTPAEIINPEKISVKPNGEAFSQSVEVRIKDDATVRKAIEDALDEVIKEELTGTTVFPLDISLYIKGTDTKFQPNTGTSVVITCPIPESLIGSKNSIKVVCIIDGKLTVFETKIVFINGVYCVQFTATHFSPYAMVVDTSNVLNNNTVNPKTGGSNSVGTFSIIAILSVATLAVVNKKRKFKVVKK